MEKIVPMKESDTSQTCPHCQSPTEKQISLPANPVFKGTGWTPKYSLKDVQNMSPSDLENI